MSENRIENEEVIVTNDYKGIIRKLLADRGITQQELADRIGVSRQNLNQMLTRNEFSIRYESFVRIIEALGCELVLRKK